MNTRICPLPQESAASAADARLDVPADRALSAEEQLLVMQHLHLVRIAVGQIRRRLPPHVDTDDLHSAGVLGLISAIRRYDRAITDKFAGFALHRIRGAILDELRRMDCCTRRMRATARELESTKQALEQKLQRAATVDEMRAALGLSVVEYDRRLAAARPVKIVSLDSEPDNESGSGTSLHGLLRDATTVSGFDRLAQYDQREVLARLLTELPETPRKVLALHYHEGLSFTEIAVVFHRSAARICQIHRRALRVLRRQLRKALES